MEFEDIRKHAIIAMFSDDALMQRFVLKGGNAISLVLRLSPRVSLDLDFSMEDDFSDLEEAKQRLERALSDRFDSAGYNVFDFKLEAKPAILAPGKPKTWGGYAAEFKLLEKQKFDLLLDVDSRRRNALVVAPGQARVFRIDISKHEYCKAKESVHLDNYLVYVYTPAAIVIEKLRAICQQLPEYGLIGERLRRPRPRDFYDIHTILGAKEIDLKSDANQELARNIFAAKDVPLSYLGKIKDQKAFHEQEFNSVRDTVLGATQPFETYFGFVIDLIQSLKPLWDK